MTSANRILMAFGVVALLAVAATAITLTSQGTLAGGGDNEEPITGAALGQASEAALAHTGGGTVTETETGDEDSYYEVEVTLANDSQVDVQLDENFNVVGDEVDGADDENENETNDD